MADRGLELLSATSIISFLVTLSLYMAGCRSRDQGSSLKPHVTGNLIHDWWFGIQQNPQFMGTDYFFYEEYMTSTYQVFRGANKQKHVFKKNPKAPIWGMPPKVIGLKLLASGYWGIARHCNVPWGFASGFILQFTMWDKFPSSIPLSNLSSYFVNMERKKR